MKSMVLLLSILSTLALAQHFPNKFDQVNIETVLSNDRVLTNYIRCLLDKGACTREGRELKSKYLLANIYVDTINSALMLRNRFVCVRV